MKKYLKLLVIFLFSLNFTFASNAKDIPASFADLAEKLMPSVVNISTTTTITTKTNPFPFQFPPGSPFEDMFKDFGTPQERKTSALGSGFIISEDGVVITNNHVIQGAEDVFVRVNGDQEFKAKIIGADPGMDIAVLKIESDKKFVPVKFGNSDKSRIGDWVIAIGNPFGLGGTVTAGIVSARNRSIGLSRYEDFIQTDASINQGNSGGPLFNMSGDVIGINTAILGQSGSIGIGFAIPSNSADRVIKQLIEFGETKRGWLGVRIQTVTKEIAESLGLKEAVGALVTDVNPDSPADKAGLKPGDIIIVFNGKKVKSMRDLPRLVGEAPVGKAASVKIWRNKKEILKTVILGRLENTAEFKQKIPKKTSEQQVKSLGIDVRDIEEDDRKMRNKLEKKTGVIIKKIDPNGAMALLPIRPGDAIISLQNNSIKNVKDFDKKLNKIIKSGKKTILLTIIDIQNTTRYIGVKIK